MIHKRIAVLIRSICHEGDCTFQARVSFLHERLADMLEQNAIEEHFLEAGVVPEQFKHDSTEEKLYAKYCDIILAETFSRLGIKSRVVKERADAPDVLGEVKGKYSLVGDAKSFRLSRTAKDQKDFKVEALNEWRNGANADYACLVAPLYQYPTRHSQIHDQAVRYNVTLLSYTHLYFLATRSQGTVVDPEPLWRVGQTLDPSKYARTYWKAVDTVICDCLGAESVDWQEAQRKALEILPKQAECEIAFWEAEKERIRQLNHDNAVKELIGALKIDSKIDVIKRAARI
jgi:hypothetical protein